VLRPARLVVLAATLVLGTAVAPAPAPAAVAIPVNCSDGPVELAWDDMSYDLEGNCGVVRVTASRATVSMPTATRLVVSGRDNTIDAKPVSLLRVRGRGHDIDVVSLTRTRVASPRTVVRVAGLVETARLARARGTLTADQISTLHVFGSGQVVRARRGFDAEIAGNRNHVGYRRLESVAVTGDDNTVLVRRGRTEVENSGAGNRIRVARRG
jgi:hypothetical protein